MYRDVFKERMRVARSTKGDSQRKVANAININPSDIALYETGKLEPSLDKLGKIVAYYGVSADWLLGLTEENKLAV